jgi:hypothetical protein
MANIQKQWEQFHSVIRFDYDLESELRQKREIVIDKIRQRLREDKKPSFEVRQQGSYAMKTGVKPVGDQSYDMDVGLHFGISDSDYTAEEVRSWVWDAIKKHTNEVKSKGPCIRVVYAKGYHLDIVMYASWTDSLGIMQSRLAHKDGRWVPADVKALMDYVKNAASRFADASDNGIDQLRRVIRYIKRWDDVCMPNEGDSKPSGLAYTLLAIDRLKIRATAWDGTADDMSALITVATSAAGNIGRLIARKPTPEYEDLFAKLGEQEMEKLKKRFQTLNDELTRARNEVDPVKATDIAKGVMGDDFPVASATDSAVKTSSPAIITTSSSG